MRSENVDRLSRLPEEILSHILSLMPTIYAVRTCILSKRWRYRWMFVTNLNLDDNHFPSILLHNLAKIVDWVLEYSELFHVNLFRLHITNTVVPKSCVSKWIDKAVGLKVCEFDIQIMNLDLPLSFFTYKTLTKLRLHRTKSDFTIWEFPSSVNLPCLKTLDIIVHTNPAANAFKLICGSPMLESLSLEVKFRNKDEEDYIFNIPTLKRLKVTLPYTVSIINKIVLHVPNIEYLFVGGSLSSVFVMEDVSSLVEACVSSDDIRFDRLHLWVELLNGLSRVELFSVQEIPFELHLPIFPNMKRFALKSSGCSEIDQFLESCPRLKHLYIEEKIGFPWVGSKLAPVCMLTSLTTIKFPMCSFWEDDIPFLAYMLWNAKVLKKVTITWKYSSSIKQEKRVFAEFLKLPRASRCCEICLHGKWSHYTSTS
ncbi:hypothetical protein SSX86_006960 [Deinandra increscens subsp. villosa]|uniref:F-box domain-containing protein n=1 Tax=Deinandra increscens subsp. villosa TaxID=3103831 RepID=A0AAP0DKH5_9ASTR